MNRKERIEEIKEKIVRKYEGRIFSTESSESRDKLLQAICSGDLHSYWMNWEDVFEMLESIVATLAEQMVFKDEVIEVG